MHERECEVWADSPVARWTGKYIAGEGQCKAPASWQANEHSSAVQICHDHKKAWERYGSGSVTFQHLHPVSEEDVKAAIASILEAMK